MEAYSGEVAIKCETCGHWNAVQQSLFGRVTEGLGKCEELSKQSRLQPIHTSKNFFCANWEER